MNLPDIARPRPDKWPVDQASGLSIRQAAYRFSSRGAAAGNSQGRKPWNGFETRPSREAATPWGQAWCRRFAATRPFPYSVLLYFAAPRLLNQQAASRQGASCHSAKQTRNAPSERGRRGLAAFARRAFAAHRRNELSKNKKPYQHGIIHIYTSASRGGSDFFCPAARAGVPDRPKWGPVKSLRRLTAARKIPQHDRGNCQTLKAMTRKQAGQPTQLDGPQGLEKSRQTADQPPAGLLEFEAAANPFTAQYERPRQHVRSRM